MGRKKGKKVIKFGEKGHEVVEDEESWDTLMQRIKKETVEERRNMNVGDVISFEQEDIRIRKVGPDEYQLEVMGSKVQKGIGQIKNRIAEIISR
jgi:hypothetical protein